MRFTKMHGAGNDYLYINCFDEPVPADIPSLARAMAHRRFGVGADGIVLICPPENAHADARMRMFNADGSEAEMCGNAIRCVAKFLYDHDIRRQTRLTIETGAGPLVLDCEASDGHVDRVRVDMGPPILTPSQIPTTLEPVAVEASRHSSLHDEAMAAVDQPLAVGGESLRVTCVSMGNPHCVIFVDELTDAWVLDVGPNIETDPHFPNRVNAEFVRVVSRNELDMRVWERGSGETWACGTGACAAAVAGVLTGRTDSRVLIHLRGGDLEIQWADDGHVFMTGPAEEVFSGEWTT